MKAAIGVIAALAAAAGVDAIGAMPDQLRELGPVAGAFAIYLEVRFRPLLAGLFVEFKAHRAEHQSIREALKIPALAAPAVVEG